jgi:hypothetical protein
MLGANDIGTPAVAVADTLTHLVLQMLHEQGMQVLDVQLPPEVQAITQYEVDKAGQQPA